jgi:ABC-2 type transport system permease protein
MKGYSAQHTLSIRVELIRQLRRRRTAVAFGLVIALPIVVSLAVLFGPSSSGGGGLADGDFDVFGLLASGPWNFALSGLAFSSAFLLVILAAMFLGDTVASEASWGTMRYLLAAPVPRRRFLLIKATVGLLLTTLAYLWCSSASQSGASSAKTSSPKSGLRHVREGAPRILTLFTLAANIRI